MPGIVLGAAVTLEGKTETVPALMDHFNCSESGQGADINFIKSHQIYMYNFDEQSEVKYRLP